MPRSRTYVIGINTQPGEAVFFGDEAREDFVSNERHVYACSVFNEYERHNVRRIGDSVEHVRDAVLRQFEARTAKPQTLQVLIAEFSEWVSDVLLRAYDFPQRHQSLTGQEFSHFSHEFAKTWVRLAEQTMQKRMELYGTMQLKKRRTVVQADPVGHDFIENGLVLPPLAVVGSGESPVSAQAS